MKRPLGVTLIGCWCLLAGVYLCSIATVQIVTPRAIPSLRLFPFIYALRTVSPYLTLAIGTVWSALAWGLFQMRDWARFTVTIFLSIGIVWALSMLISHNQPTWRIVAGSFGIALRASAVWYLMLPATIDAFNAKQSDASSRSTAPRQL
jgi:hypothetical protein